MRGVMGVGGIGRMKGRQFGGHGLAGQDGARPERTRHDRSVLRGPPAGKDGRAELGREIRCIDDVLDAERQAEQAPPPGRRHPVQLPCPFRRLGRVQRRPGPDRGLARRDPAQARVEQLAW